MTLLFAAFCSTVAQPLRTQPALATNDACRRMFSDDIKAYVAWLHEEGKTKEESKERVNKRIYSLTDTTTWPVAPPLFPVLGNTAAPARVTVYMMASCGMCKKVISDLRDSITSGPLENTACLEIKNLTVRIGDIGLAAAAAQGKFWEFFEQLKAFHERLDRKNILHLADSAGIDIKRFTRDLAQPALLEALNESRTEARANGVTVTPAIFINNHAYQSNKHPRWISAAIHYRAACEKK